MRAFWHVIRVIRGAGGDYFWRAPAHKILRVITAADGDYVLIRDDGDLHFAFENTRLLKVVVFGSFEQVPVFDLASARPATTPLPPSCDRSRSWWR